MEKTTVKSPLGAKFKELERTQESVLETGKFYVLRLDGKALHTFTRNFARPYDLGFIDTMDQVSRHLCDVVDGALFAYTQSDEISVVFTDTTGKRTEPWIGGRLQKIISVSAANASAKYMQVSPQSGGLPIFDSRLITVDSMDDVAEYVDWRRKDAMKNAVTMAAGTLYSLKQLLNVPTRDRVKLLEGTEYEVLPDGFFFGRLAVKEQYRTTVTFTRGDTGVVETTDAVRSRWVTVPATKDAVAGVLGSDYGWKQ